MRAELIAAFYIILRGNPMLLTPRETPCKTRFKMWWRLVGSAVEHAASLANPNQPVDFQTMFLDQEEDDEETSSLADILAILAEHCPTTFTAADVATMVNEAGNPHANALRDFLYPGQPPGHLASPKSVGKVLQKHRDEPVKHGENTLILRSTKDRTNALTFFVGRPDGEAG
jgi:hypothetical protein